MTRLCPEARCRNCDQRTLADPSRAVLLRSNAATCDFSARRRVCRSRGTRHVTPMTRVTRPQAPPGVTSADVMMTTMTCSSLWDCSLRSMTSCCPVVSMSVVSLGCGWRIRDPHPQTSSLSPPGHYWVPYHRHAHITYFLQRSFRNSELF